MTRKRPGFKNVFVQVPDAVWDAVAADADRRGESFAHVLAEALRRHYKLPASAIPPRRRAGRKQKGLADT
jgi:hypothetical protein